MVGPAMTEVDMERATVAAVVGMEVATMMIATAAVEIPAREVDLEGNATMATMGLEGTGNSLVETATCDSSLLLDLQTLYNDRKSAYRHQILARW